MKKIVLNPLWHRNRFQIAIGFDFDESIKSHLKKLKGISWSQTHRVFYLELTSENKQRLFQHFNDKGWYVDYSALKDIKDPVAQKEGFVKPEISKETRQILWEFVSYLRGKRFSESTVRTYYNFVFLFLEFQKKDPSELTNRDVELFIEKVIVKRRYAVSTHRQCISGLKHFARLYTQSNIDPKVISSPKKSSYTPTVLSKEEIIDLLRATRNLKHRAVLALIYSSGLRIGELLNLKIADLDVDRRQVHVHQGKGRKDRNVVMAESIIPLLFNYLNTYKPAIYFVEGLEGVAYSSSSVRAFLKVSCQRAKILKKVSPHCLRHSFATHMLENGTDIRYIQEILGHSRPETTMIYTHVAQKDLLKIRSPLDVTLGELAKNDKEGENMRLSRNNLG
ncbi:tyrosine-type recombinase/integrase [Gillisia limnaea]|uniref:Integrase family protein n=1 Tax=Gillisia limnaea (strain DSM 15749 / LMG 21470 / R-8282) TaxID=865937 RepID=H2C0B7_GILLR|nr:site-specific integrase [Gillisia limnaea]EHQ01097.1 integrase family protein [Gillisia limnaea DSM 15749]